MRTNGRGNERVANSATRSATPSAPPSTTPTRSSPASSATARPRPARPPPAPTPPLHRKYWPFPSRLRYTGVVLRVPPAGRPSPLGVPDYHEAVVAFAFRRAAFAPPGRRPRQVAPDKAMSTFTVVRRPGDVAVGVRGGRCSSTRPASTSTTRAASGSASRSTIATSCTAPSRSTGPRATASSSWKTPRATGKADKATVFYQSPELLAPLGIAVAKDPVGPGYKVFVCQSPDILVFEDKDGDGKADGPPKKLLTGFGGFDHDHGVHGILIGPDVKLYFSVGDTRRRHGLQSSDGKGRKWTSNTTDCRAGTIWRCDLDGKNLELIAHNFRNEYEPCVDSFGTVFVSDNDDDGNQQTRICYVMPGGNYGYHPRGTGPEPLARGTARHRAEDPAHLLRLADRHVRLRRHAAAEEVLGPAAAHRRRPAPRALLPPEAEGGRLRRGPRGHGDEHRQLVSAFGHLRRAGRQRLRRRLVRSRRRRPRHGRHDARPHLPAGAEGQSSTACRRWIWRARKASLAALASPNLAVRYMAMAKTAET